MRFATAFLLALATAGAQAQPAANPARAAINAFVHICVDTQADRNAASSTLVASGWTSAGVGDIPRTRRGTSGHVVVQIDGDPPPNSQVYIGRSPAGDIWVVWLATYEREEGQGRDRRAYQAAGCTFYALGVTAPQLAEVLFPTDAHGDEVFVAAPIAFPSVNGRHFMTGISRPSLEGPYARWGSMAFFTHEEEMRTPPNGN